MFFFLFVCLGGWLCRIFSDRGVKTCRVGWTGPRPALQNKELYAGGWRRTRLYLFGHCAFCAIIRLQFCAFFSIIWVPIFSIHTIKNHLNIVGVVFSREKKIIKTCYRITILPCRSFRDTSLGASQPVLQMCVLAEHSNNDTSKKIGQGTAAGSADHLFSPFEAWPPEALVHGCMHLPGPPRRTSPSAARLVSKAA